MLGAVFRSLSLCFMVFVALWGGVELASAQLPGLNSLQGLQGLQGLPNINTQGTQQTQAGPNIQNYTPIDPSLRPLAPPSRLEDLYSNRAGRPLLQFGYEVLGIPSAVTTTQLGAVQDNYVLGQGDQLLVVLRGQDEQSYTEQVNRDGLVILPRLNPIPAAGRTLGEFRTDLERQVARTYISTNVFVSLGNIRQISVLVTGEVRAPGVRTLSALASPIDALLISGGIAKTGSLRNVVIIRGDQTQTVDLYGLLTRADPGPLMPLRNGDRIYVPPLGNTIAVAGLVRRPGIYELKERETGLDANVLIGLAGGVEIPGGYRLSKMELEPDGTTRLVSLAQGASVANGEILFVDSAVDFSLDRVRVSGATRLPGAYPRTTASSVGRLIQGVDNLDPAAFTPFAVVVRRDPRLNTQTLLPFSLSRVLARADDVPLQNEDLVYVFTRSEIHELAQSAAAAALAANPDIPIAGQAPFNQGVPGNLSGIDPNAYPGGAVPGTFGQPNLAPGAQNGPAGTNLPQGTLQNPQGGLTQNAAGANLPYTILPSAGSAYPSPAIPGRPTGAYTVVDPKSDPNAVLNPNSAFGTNGPVSLDRAAQTAQQQLGNPARGLSTSGVNNGPIVLRPDVEPNDILTRLFVSPETRRVVRNAAQQLGVTTDMLVRMATDHLIWVLDQVKEPGPYLSAGAPTLEDMLQIAGGPLDRADLSSVEVTSTIVDPLAGVSRTERVAYKGAPGDFRRVTLRPLDVVRLRPVFSDRDQGQVAIAGQVRFPGSFDITRAERLSSLLERAGGLTEEGYAYGAIFTRRAAAIAEREGNLREARELESQALTPSPLSLGANEQDPSQRLQFANTLAQQLRDTPVLGRIAVTADPAILRVRPELDVLLEPGDYLYIPKRPSTVTVSGEVLNNGTIQYETGLTVRDYIERAGGTTQGADSGRTFVVLPDGSARPVSESWLSFNNTTMIPPGSTIIVPRDVQPFSLGPFVRDMTQIISQIAITAASLAVISK